jgi:glucokinase
MGATQAGDRLAIGIDIGGTKIAGGVVAPDGEVLVRDKVPTPGTGDAIVSAVEALVAKLRAASPDVAAIGVGAAGLVEWPEGRIRWAPNNAYRDLPLRALLAEKTGLPVRVDNDANVAAWAEARFGAGEGSRDLVLIAVGTGIGGGLVLDGKVYRGATGMGAELGHMLVDVDGAPCACGRTGCLEAMASGSALGRYGREAAGADPDGLLARLAGSPDKVTGLTVAEAAGQDDKVALELFDRLGFWLGVGIVNAITIFDPAVVVIGGGLIANGELLLAPARAATERLQFGAGHLDLPPIVAARLGPEAGVVGAASIAFDPDD